jgi:dihydropteroate synthase
MQRDPHYQDCVAEVRAFLAERLASLAALGVKREYVAVDPGIGFGKRLEDNLALINHARDLHELGCPVLYGVSRKSFIGALSGEADPGARLPGTLGVTWALLERGVMLHRVHDIAATRQLMAVWQGFRALRQ